MFRRSVEASHERQPVPGMALSRSPSREDTSTRLVAVGLCGPAARDARDERRHSTIVDGPRGKHAAVARQEGQQLGSRRRGALLPTEGDRGVNGSRGQRDRRHGPRASDSAANRLDGAAIPAGRHEPGLLCVPRPANRRGTRAGHAWRLCNRRGGRNDPWLEAWRLDADLTLQPLRPRRRLSSAIARRRDAGALVPAR